MRYRDMVFTKNDEARLRENRDAICNWIMENIVPMLNKDDVLDVDFYENYRCQRTGFIETYRFRVYGRKERFYIERFRGNGYVGFGRGRICEPFEENPNPYDIYPVVDNWRMIKSRLLKMVTERKQAKRSIYEFEV